MKIAFLIKTYEINNFYMGGSGGLELFAVKNILDELGFV